MNYQYAMNTAPDDWFFCNPFPPRSRLGFVWFQAKCYQFNAHILVD